MRLGDRLGPLGEQPGRPQLVAQVVPGRLELVGHPAVQDDRPVGERLGEAGGDRIGGVHAPTLVHRIPADRAESRQPEAGSRKPEALPELSRKSSRNQTENAYRIAPSGPLTSSRPALTFSAFVMTDDVRYHGHRHKEITGDTVTEALR